MVAFIQMLIGALVASIPSILAKIGLGVVAYQGIDTLVNAVKADVLAKLGGLPPVALQLVGVLQIGTGVNIICSALIVRFVMSGLVGGTLKKVVVK
jgi:hypothetical protein